MSVDPALFRLRAFEVDWLRPLQEIRHEHLKALLLAEGSRWVALGRAVGYFGEAPLLDVPAPPERLSKLLELVTDASPTDAAEFGYHLSVAQDDLTPERQEFLHLVYFEDQATWDDRVEDLRQVAGRISGATEGVLLSGAIDGVRWALDGAESQIPQGGHYPSRWRSSGNEIPELWPWATGRVEVLEKERYGMIAAVRGVASRETVPAQTHSDVETVSGVRSQTQARIRMSAPEGLMLARAIAPASASDEGNRGTVVIEPLDRALGDILGNSLRRVLLSLLAGAAVTSVRIEGISHESSAIPGVKEDLTDIILNLKEIVCRMNSDATEVEVPLVVTGPKQVTAGDIDLPSGVEILNPEARVATLEERAKLEIYLTIGLGRGYKPTEESKISDQAVGVIPIDSLFSPVKRVAYSVDSVRAHRTDYDRLTLDIETDGSLNPRAAVREAAEILISPFAIFSEPEGVAALPEASVLGGATSVAPAEGMDDVLIEELELGVRSYNVLKRAGVHTVGDLLQKSELELDTIPNLNRGQTEEVREALEARGLSLRASR